MRADILAIAAHPDDLELTVAGTLLRSAEEGHTFVLCDLTEGERGSRGSRETRREESRAASRALGIEESRRLNLSIPDGDIALSKENIRKLVEVIRDVRPRILLFPWEYDRHPDHVHAHALVR